MITRYINFAIAFVLILFIRNSFAQNANILIDSVNARVKIIADTPNKDSNGHQAVTSDTLKNAVIISKNPILRKKDTKKSDTVYFIEAAPPLASQSNITFDAGQMFSTFRFIDSKGNKGLDYTHNLTGTYSVGYQYITNKALFYRANIGLRKAGASLVKNSINYNWIIQYADANVGIGYILDLWRIKPYFSLSPYLGYMMKANQTIGLVNYDIKGGSSIKSIDFGLFFSPGIRLALSQNFTLYGEYKYILGLHNLEKSSSQKSFNRGFSFNLGLSYNIITYHQQPI